MSMREMSARRVVNGVLSPVVYGSIKGGMVRDLMQRCNGTNAGFGFQPCLV